MSAKSRPVSGRVTVPLESERGGEIKTVKIKWPHMQHFSENMSRNQSPSSFHPFMLWKNAVLCHRSCDASRAGLSTSAVPSYPLSF